MKYLKILGLAAIAATALMAFAGPASATRLTAPAGTVVKTGTTISSSLVSKTSAVLSDTSGFIQNTCTGSSVSGKTTNENATTITGNIDTLTFSTCTRPTKTLKNGTLHISSTGTVTGSGSEVETETVTGVCVYGTGTGTHLGTLTNAATSTSHASLVINAVLPLIKTISGSCVSDARWKAEYTVTSPVGLVVDAV